MIKFKKGDKVYEIGTWDNKGTFYYKEIEIKSWGAKQGTAISMKNGKFTESRIYVTHANCNPHGSYYFPVATTDPVAKALELAAAFIAHELESYTRRLGLDAYHHPSIKEKVEFFTDMAKPVGKIHPYN